MSETFRSRKDVEEALKNLKGKREKILRKRERVKPQKSSYDRVTATFGKADPNTEEAKRIINKRRP